MNANASGTNMEFWEIKLCEVLMNYNIIIRKTKDLIELKRNINIDINSNTEMIIAIGGDGTMNCLIQEIAGSKIKLFMIPTGTANDLAGQMGIKKSLKSILANLKEGDQKQIDLIKVNEKYIATNGGIGLASDVASQVNKLRVQYPFFRNVMKFCKGKTYSLFVAAKLLSMNNKRYKVLVESPDLPYINDVINTPIILINNQSNIATDFQVAPETKNNDGTFNVTIFKHQKNIPLAITIIKMILGRSVKNDSNITSFETKSVTINSADGSDLYFFGDGEVFKPSSVIKASITPNALEVCFKNHLPQKNNPYKLEQIIL
jgi:diacylglycerol kinase family enzyme